MSFPFREYLIIHQQIYAVTRTKYQYKMIKEVKRKGKNCSKLLFKKFLIESYNKRRAEYKKKYLYRKKEKKIEAQQS